MSLLPEVYNFDAFGAHIDVFLLKAGEEIPKHQHSYPQVMFLAKGTVTVRIGPVIRDHTAPTKFVLDSNAQHGVFAVTDAVVVNAFPET